jgi:hypothetical protein
LGLYLTDSVLATWLALDLGFLHGVRPSSDATKDMAFAAVQKQPCIMHHH